MKIFSSFYMNILAIKVVNIFSSFYMNILAILLCNENKTLLKISLKRIIHYHYSWLVIKLLNFSQTYFNGKDCSKVLTYVSWGYTILCKSE